MRVRILIDDREQKSGLAEALREASAHPVALARLAVGDVQIGDLTVERKEAGDFIASLLDGRLTHQLDALARTRGPALVLIEGEFNPRTLAGMAPREVRQAILAITLDRRIPVLRSRDLPDSARWLAALADRQAAPAPFTPPPYKPAAQPARPHPAAHRAPRRTPAAAADSLQIQLAALRRVPGIGPAKAASLLQRFGSIHAILAAAEHELASAAGIGPALAAALRQTLSTPPPKTSP